MNEIRQEHISQDILGMVQLKSILIILNEAMQVKNNISDFAWCSVISKSAETLVYFLSRRGAQ